MDKNSQLKKQHQDKILFAVEQLEKVKKFFLEEHRDEEMDTDYIITKDAGEIADYLLDQIKQLKEKSSMDYFNHITQEFEPQIDVDKVLKRNEELEEENKKLKKLLNNKILLAEDGSVDVDKLEQDGFYVIIYRQGAKPPMWLAHQHEDKGDEVV